MSNLIDVDKVPVRTLYTGVKMPAMGLGTFGSDKYSPEQISEAVYGAVRAGYRMLDCASVYQNEDRIGEVLERLFKEGIVNDTALEFPYNTSESSARGQRGSGWVILI